MSSVGRNFRKSKKNQATNILCVPMFVATESLEKIKEMIVQNYADFQAIEVFVKKMFDRFCAYIIFNSVELAVFALDGKPIVVIENQEIVVTFSEEILEIDSLQSIPICDVNADISEIVGLQRRNEFISESEEIQLCEFLYSDATVWCTNMSRRVIHYGFEFDYETRDIGKIVNKIPDIFDNIIQRIADEFPIEINQLTVNEYLPGQGIRRHVDTHSSFTDIIISLSLLANTVMCFEHPDGRKVEVFLPRRSLVVMSGPSRYLWSHCISLRKHDRYLYHNDINSSVVKRSKRLSVTFRQSWGKPCNCEFLDQCNWNINSSK